MFLMLSFSLISTGKVSCHRHQPCYKVCCLQKDQTHLSLAYFMVFIFFLAGFLDGHSIDGRFWCCCVFGDAGRPVTDRDSIHSNPPPGQQYQNCSLRKFSFLLRLLISFSSYILASDRGGRQYEKRFLLLSFSSSFCSPPWSYPLRPDVNSWQRVQLTDPSHTHDAQRCVQPLFVVSELLLLLLLAPAVRSRQAL